MSDDDRFRVIEIEFDRKIKDEELARIHSYIYRMYRKNILHMKTRIGKDPLAVV